MSVWVLIVYLGAGYGGGPTTAVFHSQEACEKAAKAIRSESSFFSFTAYAACFEDKQ